MLRISPNMENKVLRDHLRELLPSYQELSAKKLQHFRRAMLPFVMNPNRDLGSDDCDEVEGFLDGKSRIPAHMEFSKMHDDPIHGVHFRELLKKLMAESGEGWAVPEAPPGDQEGAARFCLPNS